MSMFGQRAHDCVSGIFFILPNCQTRIPLPLLNINAKATITSTNTHLLLTQTFKIPEHTDIKTAKYTFPLYAHSAVSSFTAHIGPNKILHAKIEKKKEAREKYEAAVKAGKTAALMNEVTAEIFTMELGNLPADTEIKVVLGVIGELKGAGEDDANGEHTLRYTLPMTIAPKYGEPPKELGWSSSVYQAGKQGLEIQVEVLSPESIKGISSPTHPVALGFGEQTEGGLEKMSASLSQKQSLDLDKDFVLEVKLGKKSESTKPWAILETHPTIPGQSAIMASFLPRLKLRKVKPEVIFVLDQSGSMHYNTESLRSAMEVFLKSLAAGVKFNICSFGSTFEFMFSDGKSRPYTEDTMDQALKYVSTLDASMGGTELQAALQATLNARDKDSDTEIIVLTDGEIWGTEQVFNLIRDERKKQSENSKDFRLFSIGLGKGVDRNLVEGMAEAGNGYAAFVGEGEAFEGKVVKMLKTALSERLLDVQFQLRDSEGRVIDDQADKEDGYESDFTIVDTPKTTPPASPPKKLSLYNPSDEDDDKLEPSPAATKDMPLKSLTPPNPLRAPHELASLLAGHRSIVYFLQAPTPLSKTLDPKDVIFTAKTSSGDTLELIIPISKTPKSDDKDTNTTIHKLAARRLIKEIEQGSTWIDDALEKQHGIKKIDSPSTYNRYVDREGEAIAMKWQILSKWTSFIVVDEEGKKIEEVAQPVNPDAAAIDAINDEYAPPAGSFKRRRISLECYVSESCGIEEDETAEDYGHVQSFGASGVSAREESDFDEVFVMGDESDNRHAGLNDAELSLANNQSADKLYWAFQHVRNLFGAPAPSGGVPGSAITTKTQNTYNGPMILSSGSSTGSGMYADAAVFASSRLKPARARAVFSPVQPQVLARQSQQFCESESSVLSPDSLSKASAANSGLFGGAKNMIASAKEKMSRSPAPRTRPSLPSSSSGGLFGAPQPTASSGSLASFGAPPPPPPSGLFGAPQPQSPSGSFGTPQPQFSSGLFGASQATVAPVPSSPTTSGGAPVKLSSDAKALTLDLLKFASFSGAFNVSQLDFTDFHVPKASISEILAQKGVQKPESASEKEWNTFCETVLVVAILKEKCASQEDVWEMVVDKAECWVEERADEWGVDGKVKGRVLEAVLAVIRGEEGGVDGIL